MLPRRLSTLVVLASVLAVSGVEPRPSAPPEPAQPDAKAPPAPPAGWVKGRLADVDKNLDGEIKDLVVLLEIFTPTLCNDSVLLNYFKFLQ